MASQIQSSQQYKGPQLANGPNERPEAHHQSDSGIPQTLFPHSHRVWGYTVSNLTRAHHHTNKTTAPILGPGHQRHLPFRDERVGAVGLNRVQSIFLLIATISLLVAVVAALAICSLLMRQRKRKNRKSRRARKLRFIADLGREVELSNWNELADAKARDIEG